MDRPCNASRFNAPEAKAARDTSARYLTQWRAV
jgi:hypothetical protein